MREQQPMMRDWHFDRYRDGRLKAQGASVSAGSLEEALKKAKDLFSRDEHYPWARHDHRDEFRLCKVTEAP